MNNELTEQLQTLLAQLQGQNAGQTLATSTTPWGQVQIPSIQGVAIPVKVDTPIGLVRCYMSLPAEASRSPQALMAAIQTLMAMGYQIDAWAPRGSGDGWGRSRGGNWNGGGNSGWSRGGRW